MPGLRSTAAIAAALVSIVAVLLPGCLSNLAPATIRAAFSPPIDQTRASNRFLAGWTGINAVQHRRPAPVRSAREG